MNLLKNAPGSKAGHTLGIRPEHLDVSTEGWEVTVDSIEMLGAERLLYCALGNEHLIVRADEGTVAPQIGQTLHVLPRADRVHQFNTQTGKRIA